MKYLLHIDTSTDDGVVAIGGDGQLLSHRVNKETRDHAGSINVMINDVLAEIGISLEDLAGIVVCAGPGSYTGLRIGIATAKGLCYVLEKPLILDNRLTLLAYQAYRHNLKTYSQYTVILTAREKEYFISIYNNDFICIMPPQHITEDSLAISMEEKGSNYIITNASKEIINSIAGNIKTDFLAKIDLSSWIFYAFEEYNCNKTVNLSTAEPFYLKQVYTHK